MPNILKLTVENATELRNASAYGTSAVIQVQSASSEAGAYSDDGTVTLVDDTRAYTYYDADGTSSTWYRTRYENGAGTTTSDWSAVFQVGDETAGLLCSLYDVAQELGIATGTNEDENILEKIRQVSRAIERYTGRWLAPRPSSGTTTYRFHTEQGLTLHIPRGIRSITTLNVASEDQPSSGGTYTTATSTDFYLDPPPADLDTDEPARWVTFRSNATGAVAYFSDASYGAEIVGAFGFASVPPDVQGVAIRAAVRRYIGKGVGGGAVAIGPNGTEILLPDMSGSDRTTLDYYKRWIVG